MTYHHISASQIFFVDFFRGFFSCVGFAAAISSIFHEPPYIPPPPADIARAAVAAAPPSRQRGQLHEYQGHVCTHKHVSRCGVTPLNL